MNVSIVYPRPKEGDPCSRRSTTFIIIPRPAVTVPLRIYLSSLLRRSDTVVTALLPPPFPHCAISPPSAGALRFITRPYLHGTHPAITSPVLFSCCRRPGPQCIGNQAALLRGPAESSRRSSAPADPSPINKAPPSCTFDQEQAAISAADIFSSIICIPRTNKRLHDVQDRVLQKPDLAQSHNKRNDLPTLGGHMLYIRTASSAWRS